MSYLESRIKERRETDRPRWGMTVMGYTIRGGAPTGTMIRLEGETRWRRLRVWCFSNIGTLFIVKNGRKLIVREHDLPQL